MDKEEEKKIKERLRSLSTGLVYEKEKVREHYIFTTKHELDDSNKSLKEYIEYLEQKEFILDKVTDKLKEGANQKIPLAEDKDWAICRKQYAREILNIIGGEKK